MLDGGYRWKVTTQLYYNRFFRNWYKLNDVRTGVWSGQKHSIGDVLVDPDLLSEAFDLVRGEKSYDGEALMLRANHRLVSFARCSGQGRMENAFVGRHALGRSRHPLP